MPVGARSVLALILNRGDLITSFSSWMSEAAIPWPLLQQIADCSEQELRDYIAVLEHAKLAWPHDPEDDTVSLIIVGNSTGETGWKIMLELKELSEPSSYSSIRECSSISTSLPSTGSWGVRSSTLSVVRNRVARAPISILLAVG